MKYPNDFINQNIMGDSVKLMGNIPDNTIDLTVTSPPYDNLRTYKGKIKKTISYDDYSFPFKDIAKELYRVTKEGGVVVWVSNDQVKNGGETGTSFRMALYFQEIGFTIYDTMIYHKNGPPFPESGRYSQVFEYMFVLSKGKPKTVNLIKDKVNRWAGHKNFGTPSARKENGELKKSKAFTVAEYGTRYNVWYINNGKGYTTKDDYAFKHPAMFPETLAEDHILSWTNENDIVFDPMCGAGTTQKMAKLNNRNYIGFDIVQEYIDISNKRINVTPYNKENVNPKVSYLVSRDELLVKRRKTREENKKKKKDEEFGTKFYCQDEIEGKKICNEQCEHCKEYYKPVEDDDFSNKK
jgi:site-specific DNA-methyltransferase (adenine-specific)